ncbi:MAG: hypothetical protein U0796_17240 [Gemmatales bacterium]
MSKQGNKQDKPLKRRVKDEDSESSGAWSFGQWFVLIISLVALLCIVTGLMRNGFPGWSFLTIVACMLSGIGFVAIGIAADFAWLEWVIGFADGIISGISGWFWTSQLGTLSENIGERGASVLWLLIGIPTYIAGCLMALGIIPV